MTPPGGYADVRASGESVTGDRSVAGGRSVAIGDCVTEVMGTAELE